MRKISQPFYESLASLGRTIRDPVPVTLSPELIGLLSEQLYRSPSKAIEELVINAYDADANEARVVVGPQEDELRFVAVYDDGKGLSYEGITDLWKVGRRKVRTTRLPRHTERKQIGKFGIGKLSTYAIANRVTYISSTGPKCLGVTIDYRDFASKADATTTAVALDVQEIDDLDALMADDLFRSAMDRVGVCPSVLHGNSWTMVILEDLKEKAQTIPLGRLRWVLRTAMPLSSTFELYLNGNRIESSKSTYEVLVQFEVCDLPPHRLEALRKKTGEVWVNNGKCLISTSLPSGISGTVKVTERTLLGKSADLGRSEGFFVYVRGRLVNEEDARFGLHELSHATLNRLHATIYADDLDKVITANRESMEDVKTYWDAQALLNEIFNEARTRYNVVKDKESETELGDREYSRRWVSERLVELPTADALSDYAADSEGTEPDESWMYLNVDKHTDLSTLIRALYSGEGRERLYSYTYSGLGSSGRLVTFDPYEETFTINEDHDLARAYASDPGAERLLRDVATGEALLEVYLRDAGIRAHTIGEVLERRDLLFRSLANAHMFSLAGLSSYIRESASEKTELEIAVVAGARALGFVAKHISGNGEPDGVARFTDFPNGEQKIILEAKSSIGFPRTKDIDFAAIATHMKRHNASGCLLLAPGYQGESTGNAAMAARENRISCWTVAQFADIVAAAESRHISARRVLEIVRTTYDHIAVAKKVEEMLAEPRWDSPDLYVAVIRALRDMDARLRDTQRDVKMIAVGVSGMTGFEQVRREDVHRAIADLAAMSRGGLLLRDNDDVILNVDYDELERRVEAITGKAGSPRRLGSFGEKRGD